MHIVCSRGICVACTVWIFPCVPQCSQCAIFSFHWIGQRPVTEKGWQCKRCIMGTLLLHVAVLRLNGWTLSPSHCPSLTSRLYNGLYWISPRIRLLLFPSCVHWLLHMTEACISSVTMPILLNERSNCCISRLFCIVLNRNVYDGILLHASVVSLTHVHFLTLTHGFTGNHTCRLLFLHRSE